MAEIVLTTLNARFAHAAFGLRYLLANLGDLADRAQIIEFDINQRSTDVVEKILLAHPKIVGIGVYIWNAEPATRIVGELRRLRPDLTIVLGGPEVSYETDQQEICRLADYIITGEADLAFADLCRKLLSGRRPMMRILPAELPQFEETRLPRGDNAARAGSSSHNPPLVLPYHLYTDGDLARRVIYVEASRGCPFSCEFCLSSLDVPVRNAPLELFLGEMQKLLDRGCRQFKFVDRTFNLNLNFSRSILQFFLDRIRDGLFVHFEMVPDRLPEGLRELICRFPAGILQFEVGIQTFNPAVEKLISRRQNHARLEENLRWLRANTGVHVHADLIVGLPGEDLDSFGRGFDKLVALGPQEIQVGMLKRLRGTPIVRHDAEWQMVYAPQPPYEILQTRLISFQNMQRMRRFSRYWDLLANSGNFVTTTPLIWGDDSAFEWFLKLSDWLYKSTGQTHAISLTNLSELLFRFLTLHRGMQPKPAAEVIWSDFKRVGRSDRPKFLEPYVEHADTRTVRPVGKSRQSRHGSMREV
ncbi:MAG TPA: DUF4080 domain-containing protein [Tepidisphaeraceae bacterium]|nr:DUF4080 domain-containing protein [Tepidisphaeraceae bacterium]